MRTICEEFLAARLPFAGLAACGIRLPDGSVLHQCFERRLLPAQVRQAIAQLALGQESLRRYHLEPVRTAWSFEHLRIEICVRPDNGSLVLFLENRPDLQRDVVENILGEFSNLTASSLALT